MVEQFKLPDGRKVDYLVSGTNDGFPFVWIHGSPGAYLPIPTLEASCKEKGLRLITLSRAGYGGSTRQKGQQIVDVVADIQALNQHLGVERCLVGGWSGGGPHALACAARLTSCVGALCIAGVAPYGAEGLDYLAGQSQDSERDSISSFPPTIYNFFVKTDIDELNATLQGEEELQKFCNAVRLEILNADVDRMIEEMSSGIPDVDKEVLTKNSEMGQWYVDTLRESLRISSDGLVDDDISFIMPWGFEFSEIKVPVLLYQGSEDTSVPYSHGQWLGEHLPQENLRKHLIQGHGHISIFLAQKESIIDELLHITKL